eukprot:10033100-Karenia_brevis.AAC.1
MDRCADSIHVMPDDQNPHQVSTAVHSFNDKLDKSAALAREICNDVIKNGGRMVWIFNPPSHVSNVDE